MFDCPAISAAPPARTPLNDGYQAVVLGGSAGSISALITILAALPRDFALPILVVQHLAAKPQSSVLPAVLGWRSRLRVKWAEDQEPIIPGTTYIAPPDRHLLIGPEFRIALSSGPRLGWWRPAVDALFLSAAERLGNRVAAVVLSGALWDGAKGMAAIAASGGVTIAQDEWSSDHFAMPAASIDFGGADLILPPDKIAEALLAVAAPHVTDNLIAAV